jgi:hypothetical protein
MPADLADLFQPHMKDLFWQMLAERMEVFYRREEGRPPPWTTDPIMKTEFITNVYRELDPGTVYVIEEILAYEEESFADKLLNIMVYRLMGSRVETNQEIGFLRCDEWDYDEIHDELQRMKSLGMTPFGEAYRTAAYADMGSKDKITNVCRLIGTLVDSMDRIVADLQRAESSEQAYGVLYSVKGFGDFLAYQIMVDMLYPAPVEPMLPFTQDDWAQAGPGARRGIWTMLKPGAKPGPLLGVMRWLRDNQVLEFERLGIDFKYMRDEDGNEVPISLCNIQASLCEYFKYARIWLGESSVVRRYPYRENLESGFDIPSLIVVDKPSEVQSISDIVVADLGDDEPSGGEHLGLGGSAVAGGELLDGAVAVHDDRYGSAVQPPTDGASQVVHTGVHVLASPSGAFNAHQVREYLVDRAKNLATDDVDAFLKGLAGLRADAAMILDNAIPAHHDPGAAQRQVQTHGYDGHFTFSSDRRVKILHVDFD